MNSHVLTGAIYNLPFDLLKDLEPVALLANNPSVVVSRKDAPAKDLKELIAWVKANPEKDSAGTSGVGAATHLAASCSRLDSVPISSSSPIAAPALAMQALVAGQIDLISIQRSSSLPQIQEGTIKAYAVMSKTRVEAAPDIPTVDEAGLPGSLLRRSGTGCGSLKDTPKDIIDKLNRAAW